MDLGFPREMHLDEDDHSQLPLTGGGDYEFRTLDPAQSDQLWIECVPYWDHLQSQHLSIPVPSPVNDTSAKGCTNFLDPTTMVQTVHAQHDPDIDEETNYFSSFVSPDDGSIRLYSPSSSNTPAESIARSPPVGTPMSIAPKRLDDLDGMNCHNSFPFEFVMSWNTDSGCRRPNMPDIRPPSERRRAQNRAAQQRYRMSKERKLSASESRVRELECELKWSQQIINEQEECISRLRIENASLTHREAC